MAKRQICFSIGAVGSTSNLPGQANVQSLCLFILERVYSGACFCLSLRTFVLSALIGAMTRLQPAALSALCWQDFMTPESSLEVLWTLQFLSF